MADEARPPIGLSVGATNLAAVMAGHAVTRKPVLTLYPHRPAEVGVPSQNPNLKKPGLVITGFVDRVGDPVGIVAADGSTHRSEALLAEGLRALAYAATAGRALPGVVAVTHPAHWGPAAVDALWAALGRVPEWSGCLQLVPDAAAALTALQANPGVPARGIIAVCDFGGSGTSITLVDAADGYKPVAATVRHTGFSGALIDQALLSHVVADLSTLGSLTRLRAECRAAKERLSSSTVTTLTADLPGFDDEIQLTRAELDDAIRRPLDDFVAVVRKTREHLGLRAADLVAVASVGGGANIPAVTTTLSEHFRVPVITTPRPHLTAAVGAALRAARGPADDRETRVVPAVPMVAVPESAAAAVSAHSLSDDGAPSDEAGPAEIARNRGPRAAIAGMTLVTLVTLAILAAAAIALLRHESGEAPVTPTPSVSTTPLPSPPPTTTATTSPVTQPPSSTTNTSTSAQPVIPQIPRIPFLPQPAAPGG